MSWPGKSGARSTMPKSEFGFKLTPTTMQSPGPSCGRGGGGGDAGGDGGIGGAGGGAHGAGGGGG
eukprot:2996521-Prymnesium_polylepis.1